MPFCSWNGVIFKRIRFEMIEQLLLVTITLHIHRKTQQTMFSCSDLIIRWYKEITSHDLCPSFAYNCTCLSLEQHWDCDMRPSVPYIDSLETNSIGNPYCNCYIDVRQTVSQPLTTNRNICSNGSAKKASDTVCKLFLHCPHLALSPNDGS